MSARDACPDPATLRAYCASEVDDASREVIRRHLQDCPRCAALSREWSESIADRTTDETQRPTSLDRLSTMPQSDLELTPMTEDYLSAIASLSLDASQSPSAVGRLGKYDILGVLGCGGMGVVLHGYDTELRREVAIKTLNRTLAANDVAKRRFMREARAAAAVNHPHVVTIHAVDQHAGVPFIVMELLRGTTLAKEIKECGSLEPLRVIRISAQIAAGLAAAHLQGVIHRDIKPGNVMLEQDLDRCKITDFGLARVAIDNLELTSREMAVGTPAYMAPEQVMGGDVDARSDLFSQGCVMYAMLVGHSPFHGRNAFEIVRHVEQCAPPDLHQLGRGIPEFLCEIVMKLLRKDPDQRFQSAAELADLLNRHLNMINQAKSDEQGRIPLTGLPVTPASAARPVWLRRLVAAVISLVGLAVLALGTARLAWHAPPAEDAPTRAGSVVATSVTVAQSGSADYASISSALRAVPAGTEIVVTDEATYVETVALDKHGVTLRSLAGATILAPDASAGYAPHALDIHDCRGVTVEGFRIRGGVGGHAVTVRGDVGEITLRRLTISQEPRAVDCATMRFSAQAARTDRPAILIDSCEISAAKYPCLWIEDQAALVAIQNSVLLPAETAVVAWGTCGSLQMTGCVVRGGLTGLNLVISNWSTVERLQVVNNTFDGVTAWLGIHSRIPEPVEVAIANNLILDGRDVEMSEAVLTDLQRRGVFRRNYWQVPADLSWLSERMGLIATQLEGDEANIPRDPQDPAYLQPTAGSVLATGGAGGAWPEYVGAVTPAGS